MTRIVLLSDVHANLPALDAVLADIARRAPDAPVYHLGDLVGYAPWPDEVVDRLRAARIPGVAAENGLWYYAIGALSAGIAAAPLDAALHEQSAELLEQVGLSEVAAFDRGAASQR